MSEPLGTSRSAIVPIATMLVIGYFVLAPFLVAWNIRRFYEEGKPKIRIVRAITAPGWWVADRFRPYYEYWAGVARANTDKVVIATWEMKEHLEGRSEDANRPVEGLETRGIPLEW